MNRKAMVFSLAGAFLLPAAAQAQDEAAIDGRLEIGGRIVDNEDESAYFQEYRDLEDAAFGSLLFRAYKEDYFLMFEGRNIGIDSDVGLDDQEYRLKSGDYRNFEYELFYNEIPHNLTFDARTIYSGVGSRFLSVDDANVDVDPSFWNRFDYKIEREQYGGQITVDLNSPFFVTIGAKKEDRDGLKPTGSGRLGAFGAVELPEPVDYETEDLFFQAGYRSKTLLFSVDGFLNDFENKNDFLDWDNPGLGFTADEFTVSTLPPDNDYGKIGADFTWKALPLSSVLAVRGSYAKLDNEVSLNSLNLTLLDFVQNSLNQTEFDGEIKYTTAYVALSSRPTRSLDTKLYYRFVDKDNNSDVIEYFNPGPDPDDPADDEIITNATELFDYTKDNAGIDIGLRLPLQSKILTGYEYLHIDRGNRPIAEETTDHLGYVEVANHALNFVTARVRYQRLERDADAGTILEPGTTDIDPEFIRLFLDRYDVTDKSQDEVEVGLDFYPWASFDFGLEYRYQKNDYEDTVLGRTEDLRHSFYGDVVWRLSRWGTLTGFGGYEIIEANSTHYSFRAEAGTPVQTANPVVEDGNPDSFLWRSDIDDHYWTYGLAAGVPIVPDRLALQVSWRYEKSDGDQDFSTEGENPLVGIDAFDDYSRDLVEAKLVYGFTANLDVTLGYLYENFDYNDLQLNNYDFRVDATNNEAVLTGANTDYEHETHVGYLVVGYEF